VRGALITQIAPGSAAERAGLQVSDLVTAIDGKAVNSSRDLRNAVGLAGIGRDLSLTIMRDGRELTLSSRIAGDTSVASAAQTDSGNAARRADDARFYGALLNEEAGALRINQVDQQSPAWAAGLRPGDLIRTFNRQSVTSLAELNRELNRQPRAMALTVERDGQQLLLIMP
jgi:S1-C subfamily serine protease